MSDMKILSYTIWRCNNYILLLPNRIRNNLVLKKLVKRKEKESAPFKGQQVNSV